MKQLFIVVSLISFLFSSCKKQEDAKPADELKYFMDFSENDHSWPTDVSHQLTPGVNGFYRMTQTQQNYQSWGIAPYSTINYNYSISADVKLYVTAPYYGGIGLIFNYVDENNYYAYYIRNDGTIFVFKKVGTVFTNLINPVFSSAIKTASGQLNHVEVRQTGSSASFLVNAVIIGGCSAPRGNSVVSAGVALITSTAPYFTSLTGDFDNVSIYKLN